MASPVNTEVNHFTSSMPGAPVLSGSTGSLVSLLDACLVQGFGIKAVTSLGVVDGVATLTFAGGASAARLDSVILVSGATPAALNGQQRVTFISTTAVAFETDEANTTATGTISFKIAPLGFLKPFASNNKAVYKSANPESTGFYLRVDDDITSDARMARVFGYESMSDIDTGSNAFPTPTIFPNGGTWWKSVSVNSSPVTWTLVGDSQFFVLHMSTHTGVNSTYYEYLVGALMGFGDMISSRLSGDPYACALSYNSSGSPISNIHNGSIDYSSGPLAMPRGYSGLGSPVSHTSAPYAGTSGGISGADGYFGPFPNAVDGSMRLSRRFLLVQGGDGTPRCDIPGLLTVPQSGLSASISHNAVIPGSGELSGRNLLAVVAGTSAASLPSSSSGISFLDITGPWR